MSHTLTLVVYAMALGRASIGLAPFLAAGLLSRTLGFPAEHDTPTSRLMARFFGVRDAGLGVLAVWGVHHPEAMGFVCLFNAAMDGGDLASIAIPLVKRQGIDRAAGRSAAFAATGATLWIVVFALAR